MSTPFLCFVAVTLYFLVLTGISFYRARKASITDYLIGSRNSTWWLITLGMVSDTLSGVTYISVPGMVSTHAYSYLQIVAGYFFGYLIITYVLLPVYYRFNLISIYSYLGTRFGTPAQKTASALFIVSRLFGSAARLYLAVLVLHQFLFLGLFSPTFSFLGAMALIVLYTYKGGVKSLVWTEAFQSVFLIAGITVVFFVVCKTVKTPLEVILNPKIFFWDPMSSHFFLKQFIGGMFITISMTGLDQNLMQVNLSCRSLKEAQKNMLVFSGVVVAINFMFLALGALVLEVYRTTGMPIVTADQLLPNLVFKTFGVVPVLFFVLGLTAASFSSASTVLPSIATSIEIDLLPKPLQETINIRILHVLVAALLLVIIYALYLAQTQSLISVVLRYAGYTYGPILGLFTIGILSHRTIRTRLVPYAAGTSILCTAVIDHLARHQHLHYEFGVELLVINALFFITILTLGSWHLSSDSH